MLMIDRLCAGFALDEKATLARLFVIADTAPSEKAPLGVFQAVRYKFRRIHIHDGSERSKFFGHFPSHFFRKPPPYMTILNPIV